MAKTTDRQMRAILGSNLKYAREQAGFTQLAAKARTGIEGSRLSRWENGHELPSVDSLLTLGALYRCSVDQFLGGIDDAYDEIIDAGARPDVRGQKVRAEDERLKAAVAQAAAAVLAEVRAQQHSAQTPPPRPVKPASLAGTSRPTRARRRR